MLPLLPIAAAGLSAVGSLFGGASARAAAKARAKALEAAARQAKLEGGVAASQGLQEDERTIAAASTRAAAGGAGLRGSAADVIDDLSRQSMYRARSTLYRATSEARNRLYEAQVARREGQDAFIQGIIGAGASMLGGFGQASAQRQQSQILSQGGK